MIDSREDEMTRGIGGGGIVSNRLKTIFSDQIRAARRAKLELLAEGVFDPVLKIPNRRLSVLNAVECVACDQRKSREPVISQRKNIVRVEMIGNNILRDRKSKRLNSSNV